MDKECRDELNRIGALDYKLFLHNILLKEEKAHRMVRRIQFRYLTYCKEDDKCSMWLELQN